MIRDRIVLRCPDQRLQERLLREPDLTLAQAMTICRAAEATKEQLRAIAGNSSAHQLESSRATSSRKSRSRVEESADRKLTETDRMYSRPVETVVITIR